MEHINLGGKLNEMDFVGQSFEKIKDLIFSKQNPKSQKIKNKWTK